MKINRPITTLKIRIFFQFHPNFRPSPQMLNLRFQIEKLVKNQRYNEAAHLQKKLSKLEEKNEILNIKRIHEKHENLFLKLKKTHENEMNALEKKIRIGKEEMLRAREKDFNGINLKFKVLKEKLEKQHRQEQISEERRLKMFKPSSNYILQFSDLE